MDIEVMKADISKLKDISNQILAGLEKDFAFAEGQHKDELNGIRQGFKDEMNAITLQRNNEIADVRRKMNLEIANRDLQIQRLQEEKEVIEGKLSDLRKAILKVVER